MKYKKPTMKNYWTYKVGFFSTNEEEVLALPMAWLFNVHTFKRNLDKLREKYGRSVIDFTIREVPERRSQYDGARLLVLKYIDGTFLARRYNRNQYLNLEF